MSLYVQIPIAVCTDYGAWEDVPLDCVIHWQDDGPIPQGCVVGEQRLDARQLERLVGKAEWSRQMELVDRWWSENGDRIAREHAQGRAWAEAAE